jgi:hypothetical protein
MGAALLGATLAGAPAGASVISIGTQTGGVGPVTVQASGPASGVVFAGPVGTFDRISVAASDVTPIALRSTLFAQNTGAPSSVNVWITETGLTAATTTLDFLSGLTDNFLPAGWTVALKTFVDPSNTAFGTATTLADVDAGHGVFADEVAAAGIGVGSLFSITQEYSVVSGRPGSNLSTIALTASAVPEPKTWMMMALGFAGLALAAWGRKASGGRMATL